ncbi:hypothetical protein [Viridibacillus arvi]|uniref:hypothetical protein n=1 Tax=Viridibacillus arvi TaxID=263475 RepID=UPI0034CF76E3
MSKMLLIMSVISAIGFIVLVSLIILSVRKNKKLESDLLGISTNNKNKWSESFNNIAQQSYNFLFKIPLLKTVLIRIRKRIETLSIYDEYSLRREVMKIIFSIFAIFSFLAILLITIKPTFLIIFWIFVGMFFVSGVLVDFFVNKVEVKMLYQLTQLNNHIRYFYQQTKMVDDAIYESIALAGPEVKIQAERIYSIITSLDPQTELAKYEEVAPSRFLKWLAGKALMIQDEGDVVSENGSAFLKSLTAINVEINTDLLFRQKLEYRLRGLTVVSIAPIFFAVPIQMWAVSTFEVMSNYYESRIGFLCEVIVYFISVLSYIMIRKIRDVSENKYYMTMKQERWEKKLLKKIPLLQKLIKIFKPKPFSKKEFKLKKLLNDANSLHDVDSISLQRLMLAVSMVILLLAGFTYGHYRETNSILFGTGSGTSITINTTDEERSIYSKESEFDREVINAMQEKKVKTKEEVANYVHATLGTNDANAPEVKKVVERITSKWQKVNNAFLKWWEVLLCFIFMYVASYVPILILFYQKKLRQKDMENEVFQFLILIGILKEFDSMSVYKILTWLEKFSIVFKEPLQEAIQNYDAGAEEAIKQLNERVKFEPLQQLLERLELATTRISIKEAFEDIEVEREYYIEKRREFNYRLIASRELNATLLCWAPVVVLIALYLAIPLVYISMTESQNLIMQIKS